MTPPDIPLPTWTGAGDPEPVGPELRAAAGMGYRREWELFCDYTAATGHPTLPTTLAALAGFLGALPARPATTARRVRAIADAHRRAGHLLERPVTGPAAPAPMMRPGPDPGSMIAACPTRGWPDGLWGRRDAFLIVLTESLGLSHREARGLPVGEITTPLDDPAQSATTVAGRAVPEHEDPRCCPGCAVSRWLDILGIADGLGRGSARMALTVAQAPTPSSPHQQHTPAEPARWRGAPVLLPAIDRHGWLDDYRPMSTRTIRARLARAAVRAATDIPNDDVPEPSAAITDVGDRARSELELDEVLTVLDDLADDAEALNTRIQALLRAP